MVNRRLLFVALCSSVVSLALAADCGPFGPATADGIDMGPKHHPVGKPLPVNPAFKQPDACGEGFWYYDRNRNGTAEAFELRLFGDTPTIACGSCHAETPEPKSAAAASVFLRQEASTLCLVCHNM